ncbi:MAG: FAD-binding oxidoreductase, partial [Oscillospiraceae bacterium]|nr:FAD-binding oxidoreductase [Oscillospiraceae bacterium]
MPRFAPLKGDAKTDVLIVGGGLAGLLCAYELKAAGADCLLVEQGELCGGVTKNTTAKITSQHGLIYHKLIREFGEEGA